MTEQAQRGMAIAMLVEAFGVRDITPVRVRVYDQALQKVPMAVLEPMTQRAIQTRKPRWGDLPTVAELLEDAEACRAEMRAAMKFAPCESCSQSGWSEREIDGVTRAVRCQCWQAHQARVQSLNVGTEPIALPAGRDRDFTAVGDEA